MTPAPVVHVQGKAIVECHADGYYVMMPDGSITIRQSRQSAENAVRNWCKQNTDNNALNACVIEWRQK